MSDSTAPKLQAEGAAINGQIDSADSGAEAAEKTAEIDEKISKTIEELSAARSAQIYPLFLD